MDRTFHPFYDHGATIEGAGIMTGERERRWAAVYAHRTRLLALCRARLDNPHDAEDCVQEAMLRCVEFADLDEERLGQFLTTVAIRLCADVHRGRARGDRLSRKLTAFVTSEPGPEDSVCDRAESSWLSRRVETLTPRQREIVEARAEGLSCGEVAARLTVSYTTVESALARARRSLRVALESTLGVAALPTWARRVLAGAATATAVVAAGTVVGAPPDAIRPRAVAPGDPVEVRIGARPATRPDRAAPAAVAAPATFLRLVTAALATAPPVAAPPRPAWAGASLPGGTGVAASNGTETWDEFLARCLRNGVEVGLVVDCGHDGGDR